ncbi:MAG: 50S ribosomal protein L10 [Nanoarchaeota archaeon]
MTTKKIKSISKEKTRHVSEGKVRTVSELTELIKNKKTILLASIKDIPASQYQELVKKLRGRAVVKVPKKNIIFRALDSSGNEKIKKLKEKINENYAVLFSDIDSFELAAELVGKKILTKAKTGQEAPEDIEVHAGPTDLIPGPAISELGALGIQIQIEKGKIHIKENKVIVKKGEKISQSASDVMNKLDIKPFSIGFIPIAIFDTKEGKIYVDIKIDREETIKEIKNLFAKALPFAVNIGYVTSDTIKLLINKAGVYEKVLEGFINKNENKSDNVQENAGEIIK